MLCFNDDNLLQLRHRTHIFPQTPSHLFLCVCALFFMGPAALWSAKCQKNHLTITKLKIKYSRKQTPMEIFKALTRENSHLCAHGWLTEVNGNYVTASKTSALKSTDFLPASAIRNELMSKFQWRIQIEINSLHAISHDQNTGMVWVTVFSYQD